MADLFKKTPKIKTTSEVVASFTKEFQLIADSQAGVVAEENAKILEAQAKLKAAEAEKNTANAFITNFAKLGVPAVEEENEKIAK